MSALILFDTWVFSLWQIICNLW